MSCYHVGSTHFACDCILSQLFAADELSKSAKTAIIWMQAIMDGFTIPENSGARSQVLDPLKESLDHFIQMRGMTLVSPRSRLGNSDSPPS